jgi:hypothetical protein
MSFCSVNVRIAIQRQKAHIMSSKGCIVCHFVRLPYKIHFLHQFKMCAPNICMESLAKKHMIKNVVLPFKTRLFPRAPICLSIVWGWVYGCRILFGVSCMPVQHFFGFLCACPLFGFPVDVVCCVRLPFFLSAYPVIFMLSSQNSCILFSSCIM